MAFEDQMPTPNTFIKHCEDVGLFQELQKVNPFDETFKKAVECDEIVGYRVKTSSSNSSELNTPFIVPITSALKGRISFKNLSLGNHTDESLLLEKKPVDIVPNFNVIHPIDPSRFVENISVAHGNTPPPLVPIITLPKILPMVVPETQLASNIASIPSNNVVAVKQESSKTFIESGSSTVMDAQKQMLLERNRSAAKRCRQKRKEKIEQLILDNQKLTRQNILLQNILLDIITKHENISVKIPPGLLTKKIR
ncbi:cyclic AMP-dependent transcription factor ATF-7 isoform X2 [Adelges cooleyi]|uniref:cyclic AMP-dependent transcription factor ATF-7 isoform X2 n=1 Tax=Adelges cooleyi TaxID=133065 RepID=UPI00217FD456|nr:cyclic AMP-dependent transcription factor ATF-7 isoform X2 [Adelges cooleyi]